MKVGMGVFAGLVAMYLGNIAAYANDPNVAFHVEQGESIMSLYGLLDIAVADEYLASYGLEAIEVAPGKALTGFSVNHFRRDTVQFAGLPMAIGDYSLSYIPFLVTKPGHPLTNAYFFGGTVTDGVVLHQIYTSIGVPTDLGTFFNITESLGRTPVYAAHKGSVSLPSQGEQSRLFIGASAPEAWQTNTGRVIDAQGVTPKANFDSEGNRMHTVSRFTLDGQLSSRPFNPATDQYWAAPDSVQGQLFQRGNFIPVQWQLGSDLSSDGYVGIEL